MDNLITYYKLNKQWWIKLLPNQTIKKGDKQTWFNKGESIYPVSNKEIGKLDKDFPNKQFYRLSDDQRMLTNNQSIVIGLSIIVVLFIIVLMFG